MIRISDAAILAVTKLRTRKIRTTVTVFTASLLFGILTFAIFVAGGVFDSAKRFTTGGLSDRYIVRAQSFDGMAIPDSLEVKTRATEIYNQLVVDKKAEAKRLGIDYDPASELKPVQIDPYDDNKYLDISSPAAQQAIAEYRMTQPTLHEKIEKLASPYNPIHYYDLKPSQMDGTAGLMKNGKEEFTDNKNNRSSYVMQPNINDGWFYLDSSITTPFLLDKKYLDAQKNITDIPIIAPYSKVQEALGLKPLSKTASQQEQLERIVYLREHASEATFTICQRNTVSQAQIEEAIRLTKDIERNKNNKAYQAPSLQYGLPDAAACAPAVVTKDTRSTTEKQLMDKQREFEKTFGGVVDPVQQKVTFRVVGLAPNAPDYNNFSTIDGVMTMIAADSLQGMWIVPSDLYDKLPNKADYAAFYPADKKATDKLSMAAFNQMPNQLVEFANTTDAKAFSEKEGCYMNCGSGQPSLAYFGSNSVLLEQITTTVTKGLGIAAAAVASIAALILMGMVGRVIGDSRRETAVFRAIGAKRNDIRMIYTIYTVLLSAFIAVSSLVIGFAGALWVDHSYATAATVRAQLMYVGADSATEFHLFGLWWQALLIVIGLVILAGLVSMLLPLSRNLARNPIRDMRDE
jgi:hypothetical protein